MRGVCPFCNRSKTVCLCVCVTVCTNDATGTVWATPGLEQLLSREHRLPLSGLKFKTKSADNDPASHCIREAGCHWQDQVTGYEQALPSTSICYTLLCLALPCYALLCLALVCVGLPVIMSGGGLHPRPLAQPRLHPRPKPQGRALPVAWFYSKDITRFKENKASKENIKKQQINNTN